MPPTSRRFASLPPFPLAGMRSLRREIEARGVDVIDLGAGDADLAPPPPAVERMRSAVGDVSLSRYAFQSGLPEFREAVARFMARRFGVGVDPETQVLPLIGSKDGLAHLPFAFVDPGQCAIIPDPGYRAYLGSVLLAGGEPHLVRLRTEHDFLVPLDDVPWDVAARSRILYLNYPNNPTTATAPDDYYDRAIDFCRAHDAVLAHDHAYSEIAFDGYRPRSVLEFDGAWDVTLEFHSLSKTFNMTGWRIGWAAGSEALIAALSRVKTFVDTGQFLAVQAAAAAALDTAEAWVPGNVETFRVRRDAGVAALGAAGFEVTRPKATMYLWVPIPGGAASDTFARRALEEQGVIVLPGAALGAGGEGYFRVACTVEEARMTEAAGRLGKLL